MAIKRFYYITVFLAISMTAASCASVSPAGTVTLDQAILEAARNIEERLEEGAKVALLNFDSPSSGFSEYVLEEISNHLVNGGKIMVVNRSELDLIRQEEEFQLSGEVSDESAQSIGKKLGAQVIISGSLRGMNAVYRFRVRALVVESAAVTASFATDLSVGDIKVNSLLQGARPVLETPVSVPVPRPAPAQTTPPSPGFVRVEGGTFRMGNATVTITGFYMGRTEVTQKEWTTVMGNNPSRFKGENLPVECLTWYDAVEYCIKLSEREGLTPAYAISGSGNNRTVRWNRNANGYRLPTEAEWEYAAMGGNGSPGNYDYAGSNNVDEVAWHDGNSGGSTQDVGTRKPNGLGLYDMIGNVWEWCWDRYANDLPVGVSADPIGPSSGDYRVIRGGSWFSNGQNLRSAYRFYFNPAYGNYGIGFRLVRP
jgi:formylglycine-generating enzyme required for sulfatase activity